MECPKKLAYNILFYKPIQKNRKINRRSEKMRQQLKQFHFGNQIQLRTNYIKRQLFKSGFAIALVRTAPINKLFSLLKGGY